MVNQWVASDACGGGIGWYGTPTGMSLGPGQQLATGAELCSRQGELMGRYETLGAEKVVPKRSCTFSGQCTYIVGTMGSRKETLCQLKQEESVRISD